jgi:hypothetical protein
MQIAIVVTHRGDLDEKEVPELFIIGGSVPTPSATSAVSEAVAIAGSKRPREDEGSASSSSAAGGDAADSEDVAIVFTDGGSKKKPDDDDDAIVVIVDKRPRVD